jgi:adenine-specific DNA-methyltransferase
LTDSGSIFVQIGDENVHRVRAVMDEVFTNACFVSSITVKKTTGAGSPAIETKVLASTQDYVLWYSKSPGSGSVKYRQAYRRKNEDTTGYDYVSPHSPDEVAVLRAFGAVLV